MKRSPGPDALLGVEDQQRRVGAVELLLDAVGHARGQRRRAGAARPGRSTSTICTSPLWCTPRIARLVVCGRSETIATFSPTTALTNVDLPTFGRPASATKPLRVTVRAAGPPERVFQQLVLQREHLARVGLVIHAEQVQHAVDDRLAQVLRVRGADHDVAELARAGGGRRARAVDRERQHVGRPGLCRGGARSAPRSAIAGDVLDGDVPVVDIPAVRGELAQPPHLIRGGRHPARAPRRTPRPRSS